MTWYMRCVSLTLFHLVPFLRNDTSCNEQEQLVLVNARKWKLSRTNLIYVSGFNTKIRCWQGLTGITQSTTVEDIMMQIKNTDYNVNIITCPGLWETCLLPSFKNARLLFSASFSMLIRSLEPNNSLMIVNCFSWRQIVKAMTIRIHEHNYRILCIVICKLTYCLTVISVSVLFFINCS